MGCIELNREALGAAEAHFRNSLQNDTAFALPWAWLGMVLFWKATVLPGQNRLQLLDEAVTCANEAIRLDASNAVGHLVLARAHGSNGDVLAAEREARRALELNPNLWFAHHVLAAILLLVKNQPEAALPPLETVLRLNPRDPLIWGTLGLFGVAHRALGDYEESIRFLREATQGGGNSHITHLNLAASLALGGYVEAARASIVRAQALEPNLSISQIEREFGDGTKPAPGLVEGLRIAGLD
jgi:tetratricopeptide (TPR) repeat protein